MYKNGKMLTLNLSIFTVFLKNRNFISKIRRSKVTDYAALNDSALMKKMATREMIKNNLKWNIPSCPLPKLPNENIAATSKIGLLLKNILSCARTKVNNAGPSCLNSMHAGKFSLLMMSVDDIYEIIFSKIFSLKNTIRI